MLLAIELILKFILFVVLQIFILDTIQFLGFVNPMIYILFILSLPVRFPRWLSLILAFLLGLVIDVFSNTLGIHTFATVLLAFVRTYVINLYVGFDEGVNPTPSFRTFGAGNYIKYIITCVLIHHFVLFLLDAFSFSNPLFLISKILVSALVTTLLILGIKSLNFK